MAKPRRHRLELPAPPKSGDPGAIERYLSDIRRLTMDEFNRLSSDYFDFQQEVINSAVVPLASVAAISVDAAQYSAVFTWENPAQQFGNPTHVRVRIAEFGDTWLEYSYPITTWTANGLNPGTDYTFQIQLVRREQATVSFVSALRNCPSLPVQVESTSEIRSRSFTTDPGIGVPEPDDDGDPVVPIPDTDDPGPVGGTHCWWEWQIQVVNLVTGDWDDTIYGGFVAGNAGNIDLSAVMPLLDPLRVYRMKVREVCNGVPGPWEYGPPFTGGNDWADDCGGLEVSDSYLEEPYSNADLWVIPYLCFVAGEGLFIREYLSGVEIIPGEASKSLTKDAEGELVWFSEEWTDTPNTRLLGSTYIIAITELDNTDDITIEFQIKLPDFPSLSGQGPYGTENLINIGDGTLFFHVTWDNLGRWGIQFVGPRESGGAITLNAPLMSTGGLANWTTIRVNLDNDGDKILFVNDTEVATDTSGAELRLDGMSGTMQIRALSGMRLRSFYGWNALVDIDPVGHLIASGVINMGAPTAGSTIGAAFNVPDEELYLTQFDVVGSSGEMRAYSIADPTAPVLLDTYTNASYMDMNFCVYHNGVLFITTSVNDALLALDVSTATNVTLIDDVSIPGGGGGGFMPMVFSNGAWVIDGGSTNSSHTDGQLKTFNTSNLLALGSPTSTTISGYVTSPSTLKIDEQYIVGFTATRITLHDVTTRTAPTTITNIASPAGLLNCGLSRTGTYLYVYKSNGTIEIRDIFNGFNLLATTAACFSSGTPHKMAVDGRHMIVCTATEVKYVDCQQELVPVIDTASLPVSGVGLSPFVYINAELRVALFANPSPGRVNLFTF